MNEAFLQYLWQHKLLAKELVTTDGLPVRVLRQGDLNRDAGPDFFNAKLLIDGIEWVGNVEIHVKASDWKAHNHSADKSYNNVILHAVYTADADIVNEAGYKMPTLQMSSFIDAALVEKYDTLVNMPLADSVPCAAKLPLIPSFMVDSFLERLSVERVKQKTDDVQRLLAEAHGGWEQCCYWLMARYFGGKTNAFPFELLAKSTDMRLLARWKNDLERLEAILYGQAGMLDEFFDDEYPRALQADYQALRSGAGLTPISSHLWKFFRIRPSSFPTLRISQFAQLLSQSSGLFFKMLQTDNAEKLLNLFDVKASEYWSTHYRFDKSSQHSVKSAGRSFAYNLLINAWVPLLFEYGNAHGEEQYKERAIDLLHQLPPEDNRIVSIWKSVGITPSDAAQSQALIQLYNNYCCQRQCLNCHFAYQVLKI